LGHPCKFQLVSRLGSVTARRLVVGVSQICGVEQRAALYMYASHVNINILKCYSTIYLFFCYAQAGTARISLYELNIPLR